jgi:predicted RNase H-like HicB family nuclease
MKYTILIEKGKNNFSAYVPDLPGCVATGNSLDKVKTNIQSAIELHIKGMKEDGLKIPLPKTISDIVIVAA